MSVCVCEEKGIEVGKRFGMYTQTFLNLHLNREMLKDLTNVHLEALLSLRATLLRL